MKEWIGLCILMIKCQKVKRKDKKRDNSWKKNRSQEVKCRLKRIRRRQKDIEEIIKKIEYQIIMKKCKSSLVEDSI